MSNGLQQRIIKAFVRRDAHSAQPGAPTARTLQRLKWIDISDWEEQVRW
jgi:hypothetical protein